MPKYDDFLLRRLCEDDKERILAWRNAERVRVNMYSDHVISADEHAAWFQRALVDTSAHYLIFEERGRPIGFVSFTGINKTHGRCTWAFYLGEVDVPRGTGAAMEFFALDYAFTQLGIRKLSCEVFAFNAGVVKLHEKFGFAREGCLVEHHLKNGKYEDIICLAKFGAGWPGERDMLKARCFKNVEE